MSIPVLIVFILAYVLNMFLLEVNVINFLIKIILYSCVYGISMFFFGINKREKSLIIIPLKYFLQKYLITYK